ncbi:MAG: fibronectin type III domain-containing protein [Lachnospiraceae bacterium]|nr:fibronectin type III domain-containing protein [Robinsoniella sp.]MDY3765324.1 fibronectin type III domain-containing protein [Lachnospiraceae bacterium]
MEKRTYNLGKIVTFILCVWSIYLFSLSGVKVQAKETALTLSAPKIVSVGAPADTTTALRVTWQPVARADGYIIYQKTGNSATWQRIRKIIGQSKSYCSNIGLNPGTKYTYSVQAFRIINGKAYYSQKYANPSSGVTHLKAPTLTSALRIDGQQVKISWASVPNAQEYRIYRKDTQTGWQLVGKVLGEKTDYYIDRTAMSGKQYYYTVKATCSWDNKIYSSLYNKTGIAVRNPSIKLNKTAVTLYYNNSSRKQTTLEATIVGVGQQVKWTSSDTTVATVLNGVVTGKKEGTAVIKATANGVSASCTVTVKAENNVSYHKVLKLYQEKQYAEAQRIANMMPSQANEACVKNMPENIKKVYYNLANEYYAKSGYFDVTMMWGYFMTDINNDGVAELLIDSGMGTLSRTLKVYTYQNGKAVKVGEIVSGKRAFFAFQGANGLIVWELDNGVETIIKVILRNNTITSTYIGARPGMSNSTSIKLPYKVKYYANKFSGGKQELDFSGLR